DPSNGKEVFIKADGTETYTWDAKDQVACGVAEPKVQGNFNTNVRWKGLSMSLIFGYRWGGKAYNTTLASKVENIDPYSNLDKRVLYDRWKQPGDMATFKSIADKTKTYATSRFIFDDDTFYASSLNIGYEFPTEWTKKTLGISYLAINGYAEDLFYLSTIKRERGTEYPFARKFSLSLTFRL
ncbi:MAG: SusC/RagA family TonB-linked outer membrane protein, partial [Prevotella sp.]